MYSADSSWNISFFDTNPVGAHERESLEDPTDIPNNLMPYISQVAAGKFPTFCLWK